MTHEFQVVRTDKQGKPVKNTAGETVFDKFIYDFDKLSIDRVLSARKLFHLSTKDYAQSPKQNDELEVLVKRESERLAFGAIIIKVDDDGNLEPYDPYGSASNKFAERLTGYENFMKLMECQSDFFQKVGLQSVELMTQSADIMMQSLNIMKEFKNLEGSLGGDMSEVMKGILSAAQNMSSRPEKKSQKSTTQKNITPESNESLTTGE